MSNEAAIGQTWASAAHATLVGDSPTYDVWIVSVRPEHRSSIEARVRALLAGARASDGRTPRLLFVPELAKRPGNLVGTLLAWQGACAQASVEGWDLRRAWRRGDRVVLVHAAGNGRRAAPLVHAEDGDRGGIWLPGTLAGAPARLLEAVLVQISPMARSQGSSFLDVIWASQLFLPRLHPDAVPAPRAPLSKFVTRRGQAPQSGHADIGLFLEDASGGLSFVPQGASLPASEASAHAADLGSFRIRADFLECLGSLYLDPLPKGPRDLDPHLTAPLLGRPGPTSAEAEAVRRAFASTEDLVGLCDVGTEVPWWRLRRPAELREAALATLSSAPERGLRHLLGIEHPITRTWLGDVWVEGPELGWEAVAEGVEVGGIYVEDCIVQDSALWPWPGSGRAGVEHPHIRGSVILGGTGALDLEDTWFVASGGPGWRGGGGLAWRVDGDAPAAAGPSPTAEGICGVRRPRLRDGLAVYHGFLHEDGKTTEALERGGAPSYSDLAHLPRFAGPELVDPPLQELKKAQPHLIVHPPATALAILRERLAPRSDLVRLLELIEDGRFVIALHRGCRPRRALDAELVPGRQFRSKENAYRLHGDLETWRRAQWSPPRVAEMLLHAMTTHFLPAGVLSREAWTERRTTAFREGGIEATLSLQHFLEQRVLDGDVGSILDRVAAWRMAEDPDRVDLAAMFDALDVMGPPPQALRTETHLRAWCRWRLERVGEVAGVMTDRLASASKSLLGKAGFVWQHPWVDHGHPIWIPRVDLRPRRVADGQASGEDLVRELAAQLLARQGARTPPTLGVCGPAAAGKSSLAVDLAERLDDLGLSVGFIGADQHCWQGHGFRYTQFDHVRQTRLYGPGIVDEIGLAQAIDRARERFDCVIVEGCYVGRDPLVRSRLDLLIGVLLDDRARLDVKFGRDALGGKRRIDVITDFADKVHHESLDGVAPILPSADRIWDRGTGEFWTRSPELSPR